jgi:dethiobiotin synthetase
MLVVCAGTATEIGKTFVGAAVLRDLRGRGHHVSARKPAQSFDPGDGLPLDAEVLAEATGEPVDEVCPPARTYPVPMAPPMAAAALGRPVPTARDLLEELSWPSPRPEVCWLETVGGPRSPIAADADAVDLVATLHPDRVVLVADAGLGTVNAVLLGRDAFRTVDHEAIVVLNRFDAGDDLHGRNADWLRAQDVDVVLSIQALADRLAADL